MFYWLTNIGIKYDTRKILWYRYKKNMELDLSSIRYMYILVYFISSM